MSAIFITPELTIEEWELEEQFVRSPGPGGQNVNKVASAVSLRFDVARSPFLPPALKERLRTVAGRRLAKNGVLSVHANRFRDQPRNREDARQRLIALLQAAAIEPKRRKATKPTRAAKERRLETKKIRSKVKRLRSEPGDA